MNRPLFAPRITRIIEIGAIGAVFILYALLKAKTLRITAADEGVYFYAAKLWLDGLVPYRDFFISHPPVHLLVPALGLWLFGINIPLLNAMPSLLVSSLTGFLTFRIARRQWGFLAGFLAAILFLFSANNLLSSNHMTGVNLSLLFLLTGVHFFLEGNKSENPGKTWLLSGAFFGLGTMTGAYVLPGFALILLSALVTDRSALRPLLKGFGLITVPVHLFFMAIAGKAFLMDVYLYHLQKVGESPYFEAVRSVMVSFLIGDRWLVFPALLGIHMLLLSHVWRREEPLSSLPLIPITLLFLLDYALFFSFMSRIFRHYLIFTLPFAALLATFGLLSVLQFPLPAHWRSRWTVVYRALAALSLGGALCWFLIATVAPYARIAFSYSFTGAYDIAIHVKKVLEPGETLYGDFGITPTVALLSGVRIAANEVDASIMRFEGDFSSLTNTLSAIEADHVGGILLRRGVDIDIHEPFREYLLTYYFLETEFVGADGSGNVDFWRRKKDVPYKETEAEFSAMEKGYPVRMVRATI